MRICYNAQQNVEKNTIVNCFTKSGMWPNEEKNQNTYVGVDDEGTADWTII